MHNILRCTIQYVFSMYTMLCYHHHCSVPEFSIPEKKPCPHQQSPPLPPPQPLTTRNPLCVCGSACSGRFPSVESHPVCPSVSASLTEHCVLRVVSVRHSFCAETRSPAWRNPAWGFCSAVGRLSCFHSGRGGSCCCEHTCADCQTG